MASRKKIEERQKAMKARQTQRTVQYIGLGVVILLIVASIWYFSPKDEQPQAQAGQDFGDATACERFADIPAADERPARRTASATPRSPAKTASPSTHSPHETSRR